MNTEQPSGERPNLGRARLAIDHAYMSLDQLICFETMPIHNTDFCSIARIVTRRLEHDVVLGCCQRHVLKRGLAGPRGSLRSLDTRKYFTFRRSRFNRCDNIRLISFRVLNVSNKVM